MLWHRLTSNALGRLHQCRTSEEFYKVEDQILPLVTFQSQAFGITLLSPQKGESLHGVPPATCALIPDTSEEILGSMYLSPI